MAFFFKLYFDFVKSAAVAYGVDFCQDYNPTFFRQLLTEAFQLVFNNVETVLYFFGVSLRYVYQVADYRRPFYMFQEPYAQSLALVRAFYQPRHVRYYECRPPARRRVSARGW